MSTTITVPKLWVFHYRCGCVYGALVADQRPQRVIATPDQACQDFYRGRKKLRKRVQAERCYVRGAETVPAMVHGPHAVVTCMGQSTP